MPWTCSNHAFNTTRLIPGPTIAPGGVYVCMLELLGDSHAVQLLLQLAQPLILLQFPRLHSSFAFAFADFGGGTLRHG